MIRWLDKYAQVWRPTITKTAVRMKYILSTALVLAVWPFRMVCCRLKPSRRSRYWRIVGAFTGLLAFPVQADPLQTAASALNLDLAGVVDCAAGAETRVGVFPFEEARLPLSPESAFTLYENLLGALIREAPDCVSYVDGRGAMVTLAYLGQTGTLRETGQAHRAEIQQSLAEVNYVLDGTILDQAGTLAAVFRLTDFARGTAISRAEIQVPDRYQVTTCGAGALPREVATRRIARALVDRAADLRHLTVVGGYFGEGDAQTSFSRLLESELVGQMTLAAENILTGATLRVDYLRQQDATRLRGLRGVSVSMREFEEEGTAVAAVPAESTGRYRLQFRYWPCEGDEAARLSVTLRSPEGRDITELGNISLAGLPAGTALRPERPPERADWGPDGAFTFQMTSQRGPNPTFRAGEKLEALFRTGRDSWLYCFYTDANGTMIQLLPNAFQIDQPQANFYAGGRLHIFPDPERLPRPDPFDLIINDDTVGIEVLRCIATARNVTADLPAALRGTSFDPIPPRYAGRLREIFEEIEGRTIANASITVTVLE
jgi:hypothetical protein